MVSPVSGVEQASGLLFAASRRKPFTNLSRGQSPAQVRMCQRARKFDATPDLTGATPVPPD
jgi:hypothetical protein